MSWQGQWAGNSIGQWFGYKIDAAVSGVTGGAGGVAKWPGRTEFGWEKWRRKEDAKLRKKKKRAEEQIEALQAEIREKQRLLDESRDLEVIESLMASLEKLEKRLSKAINALDLAEMEEVLMLWTVIR